MIDSMRAKARGHVTFYALLAVFWMLLLLGNAFIDMHVISFIVGSVFFIYDMAMVYFAEEEEVKMRRNLVGLDV